jgi:hypothetical protein
MEYYSALKNDEIMLYARKWMELEIMILTEIRQALNPNMYFHSYVKYRPKIIILIQIMRNEYKRGTV